MRLPVESDKAVNVVIEILINSAITCLEPSWTTFIYKTTSDAYMYRFTELLSNKYTMSRETLPLKKIFYHQTYLFSVKIFVDHRETKRRLRGVLPKILYRENLTNSPRQKCNLSSNKCNFGNLYEDDILPFIL